MVNHVNIINGFHRKYVFIPVIIGLNNFLYMLITHYSIYFENLKLYLIYLWRYKNNVQCAWIKLDVILKM